MGGMDEWLKLMSGFMSTGLCLQDELQREQQRGRRFDDLLPCAVTPAFCCVPLARRLLVYRVLFETEATKGVINCKLVEGLCRKAGLSSSADGWLEGEPTAYVESPACPAKRTYQYWMRKLLGAAPNVGGHR